MKDEAKKINEEMQKACAMYEAEVNQMKEDNKAHLDKLEAAFQTFMLLQVRVRVRVRVRVSSPSPSP